MNFNVNFKLISIGLIIVIIQTFMYVSAPALFPANYVQDVRDIMLLYMILTFSFTLVTGYLPVDVKKPAIPELISFMICFFLFAGVLWQLPLAQASGAHMFQLVNIAVALPVMLIYAFVVGYTEELVFRGTLPYILGDFVSSVLFGVFHWYSYQGNLISIVIAIGFGLIFSVVRDKFGLMGAVGMHTAWNLKLLGAF